MSNSIRPFLRRERDLPTVAIALILALVAVASTLLLLSGTPAVAGSLHQDSPLAPMNQDSPLPESASPTVAPNPTATAITSPTAISEPGQPGAAAPQPVLPVWALAGIMLVIGVVALVIGMRRS